MSESESRSAIAVGRVFGLLIAVIGIGISIHYARQCLRKSDEFHQWVEARPMELTVDLSRQGQFSAPFRQTCSISHGEAILLELRPSGGKDRRLDEALQSLRARIEITDAEGEVVETARIDGTTIYPWTGGNVVVLTQFVPFPRGEYFATIHVDSGAPALAGRSQLLYAKYQLCGLEQFPAVTAGGFSIGSGLIGFASALIVLPGLLRYGLHYRSPVLS